MAKTKLINVVLDDQTLGYLKSKRDQVVAATRTLELASQNVAWALKDFHNDYQQILGTYNNLSEQEIAVLQELNPDSLPHLATIMPLAKEKVALKDVKGSKKRKKRDPNMPKKPMTVFLAFSTEHRAKIRAERQEAGLPPLASAEMAAEVTLMWSELPEEKKEEYRVEYQERLAAYRIAKANYLNGITAPAAKIFERVQTEPANAANSNAADSSDDDDDEDDDAFADALENPEDIAGIKEEVEEAPKKRVKKN